MVCCYAEDGKYDASFVGTDCFSLVQSVNTEGEDILKQLFRFASKRLGREFTSYYGRAWARVSCNLQRSVSQAIFVAY